MEVPRMYAGPNSSTWLELRQGDEPPGLVFSQETLPRLVQAAIQARLLAHPAPAPAAIHHPVVTFAAPDLTAPGLSLGSSFLPGSTAAGLPLPFSTNNFQAITTGEFNGVGLLGTDHSSLVRLPPWTRHVG